MVLEMLEMDSRAVDADAWSFRLELEHGVSLDSAVVGSLKKELSRVTNDRDAIFLVRRIREMMAARDKVAADL